MTNKKILNMSKMGYRDDSPFNHLPYIDIHTDNGIIDMSATGIPLIANGRYLASYSGQHQFNTNIVRETPYQTGGYTPRLVQTVPNGYIPMQGKPNYYHNPQQSQRIATGNGTLASDADWNAFLQTSQGIAWKQKQSQQSDDYVYTQPQAQIVTPNIRDNFAAKAGGNGWLFDKDNHSATGRIMYPIRKTNDIAQNGNLVSYDSDVYYQPMNGLGKDVGEGKVIASSDFNNRLNKDNAYPIKEFNDYKYPVKPTDIAINKPLKKGGYINAKGRYVHEDGVTTSKPGLWSNVHMKNKKQLGGVIPNYQLGKNNFMPVGSTILPGTNTTTDKSLCPPGFAFVGGECVEIQSKPEANIGGGSSILPTAKTDYVTEQYKTDPAFAKRYDDSIQTYLNKPKENKNIYNPQNVKLGMLGINAIAGIAGTMYDNNYKMANARRIQADSEYNPSFSYGPNDYGVAKKGGFLQHLAEGGDVNGGEFDAYDFLFNDEDDKSADEVRTTTEDIAAATAKADEYAAIAKENEELRAQAEEQDYNNLAMGEAMRASWKAPEDSDNQEVANQNLNYNSPTNTNDSMNAVKTYYQSKGYEPEFIAGVLGNIHAESNGRSNINEGNGGGGYGLFQHTGARRTQLVNFAKARNMSAADPIAQAMFAEQEPDFQNAHKTFQNSSDKSPGKAAVIFEQKFERAGIKRYGARIGAANSIYQSFKSGGEYEVSDTELQDLIRKGIQFQMM